MLYSDAPRCNGCAERALLDKPGADALVGATAEGALEAFPCPFNEGQWHVWAPKVETKTMDI